METWERTQEVVKAGHGKVNAADIAAVGITNQREKAARTGSAPRTSTPGHRFLGREDQVDPRPRLGRASKSVNSAVD